MCAIFGFNFDDQDLLSRMGAAQLHRGPDAQGQFCAPGISLGHNRLSIIDLSERANQPMRSADGRYVIVFNGEIYNYRELRSTLQYPFRSESDTEVLLALYERDGVEMLRALNGIYAFAIWDTAQRRLFVARDPMGVKPFYYHLDPENGRFLFSSELKAILEYGAPRVICREALECYLRMLYVPAPLTMFQGIAKLPAGHSGTLQNGRFTIERFYEPRELIEQQSRSYSEWRTLTFSTVMAAVERQLISDRPVGMSLSGGLDSSIVLACMRELRGKVSTYSVGYALEGNEESGKFNADFNLARESAKFFGTHHHEIVFSSDDFLNLFEQALWHLDEPIANSTELPMLKLAQLARQEVTVLLGGDGGDELFGGYPRYWRSRILSAYLSLPGALRTLVRRIPRIARNEISDPAQRYIRLMFEPVPAVAPLLSDTQIDLQGPERIVTETYFRTMRPDQFDAEFLRIDRACWLVDESLHRSDRTSMAAGIEARVPLLDLELVNFADSMPLQHKVGWFSGKRVLREAFRSILPPHIFNQPKRGWISPIAKWLRHPAIIAWAREVLSPNYYSETAPLFDWAAIGDLLAGHIERRRYNRSQLLALLTFQVWAKRYKVLNSSVSRGREPLAAVG